MNINNNLSDSSSSLLSPSVDRHSSSESSFFDCQSSCNTSILDELDELDEEFTSIETLLPLYEHSTTYYDSFVQSFSELVLKHKLSDEAANDFLSLTKSVLPTPNNVPKNIKKIYNDILKNRNQYVHPFYYCKNCKQCSQDKICSNCRSDCIIFNTLDVTYQIKSIINRDNIRDKLILSKNYYTGNNETLKTCLYGSVYQEYLKTKRCDVTISLCLNSDGAPLERNELVASHCQNY